MKKKGFIVFETLMKGIIVLIVLGFGIKLIGSLSSNPIQYLLGFGDIKKFDEGITERYEGTKVESQDARASINGLLYAINRLAILDTYQWYLYNPGHPLPSSLRDDVNKRFGPDGLLLEDSQPNVAVELSLYDRRTITLQGKTK